MLGRQKQKVGETEGVVTPLSPYLWSFSACAVHLSQKHIWLKRRVQLQIILSKKMNDTNLFVIMTFIAMMIVVVVNIMILMMQLLLVMMIMIMTRVMMMMMLTTIYIL